MSQITRTYTFTDGTIAYGSQVDTEIQGIVTAVNNLDSGAATWANVNATASTITTLTNTTLTSTTATVTSLANRIQKYRRPVLQYNSGTVVNVETGINGTSGQLGILFPDGTYRTDSTTGRIQCNLAQNSSLTGTAQSGLRTGSQSANTWYSFYAVKSQVNTTDIVIVADTLLPLQANFSTINTNFGTDSWVFLGTLPNGDNSGATNVILKFAMTGNFISLRNTCAANGTQGSGIRIATQSVAGATLTFTYAAGTNIATPALPNQISMGFITSGGNNAGQETLQLLDGGGNNRYAALLTPAGGTVGMVNAIMPVLDGIQISGAAGNKHDIFLTAYWDGALGLGPNTQL